MSTSEGIQAVARWEQRAFLIARRLAAIEVWHWAHKAEVRYEPPAPLPRWSPMRREDATSLLQLETEQRGHTLYRSGRYMVCRRCHKRRYTANYRFWTRQVCKPVSCVKRKPDVISDGGQDKRRAVHQGGLLAHLHDGHEDEGGGMDLELYHDGGDYGSDSGYHDCGGFADLAPAPLPTSAHGESGAGAEGSSSSSGSALQAHTAPTGTTSLTAPSSPLRVADSPPAQVGGGLGGES